MRKQLAETLPSEAEHKAAIAAAGGPALGEVARGRSLARFVILGFLIRYRRGSSAPRPPLRLSEWKFEAAWISATSR